MQKKKIGHYRRESRKTGGGSGPPSSPSASAKFIEAIDSADFAIDESPFDSDGVCRRQVTPDTTDYNGYLIDSVGGTQQKNVNNTESVPNTVRFPSQ